MSGQGIPPLVRVPDDDGRNVVINLNHVVRVDAHYARSGKCNVRFVNDEAVLVALTVDEFWDLIP